MTEIDLNHATYCLKSAYEQYLLANTHQPVPGAVQADFYAPWRAVAVEHERLVQERVAIVTAERDAAITKLAAIKAHSCDRLMRMSDDGKKLEPFCNVRQERDAAIAEGDRVVAIGNRLLAALEEIRDTPIGKPPAHLSHMSAEKWARECYSRLRTIARLAINPKANP